MLNILRIILLDIRLLLKDRTFYLKLLLFPLVLIAILGMVFQNNSSAKITAFSIAYYNEDTPAAEMGNTSLGTLFASDVLQSNSLKETIHLIHVSSPAQAKALLKNGKAAVYLHVPAAFTQSWMDGTAAVMEQDTSGAQSVQKELLTQLETGFIQSANSRLALEKAIGSAAQKGDVAPGASRAALAQAANATVNQVDIPEKSSGNGAHPITAMQYYAVGMTLMFSILTAFLLIHGVVQEKQDGTFLRITSTPLPKGQYLAGKLLGIALSVVLQMVLLIAFTTVIYRIDWGTLLPVLFITLLYGFTVGAFILLLGLTAKNHTSVSSMASLLLYGFSFLGGSFVPVDSFPPVLLKLHTLVPNGAALDAYLAVANGKNIGDITGNLLCIAGYAAAFLLLSFITLTRKGGTSNATAPVVANAA